MGDADSDNGAAGHAGFAARLRGLIDERGSILTFAALARVSEGTVRGWLRGSETPRNKLAAIAKATGVSLDWLVLGVGQKFYSECPPGHVSVAFYDFAKTGGFITNLLGLGKPDALYFFSREFLGIPEEPGAAMIAVTMLDDHMEPSIVKGDLVVIGCLPDFTMLELLAMSSLNLPKGGPLIYAIADSGALKIRLVSPITRPRPGFLVRALRGEKPRRIDDPIELSRFRVLGLVCWRGGAIVPPGLVGDPVKKEKRDE
ncbi:MAG TPA: helix-turn-helix transcriptional regulator [Candidatus Binataceae bacterium]|nr:helix-turn-helix transcriptional regulator [Candidatus Binataceae bacterium]